MLTLPMMEGTYSVVTAYPNWCAAFLFSSLTELEENIVVLDPAATELIPDTSSHFNNTFLYLQAQLRRSTPNDDKIHLGHRAVMKLVPYQLDPALRHSSNARLPRSSYLAQATLHVHLDRESCMEVTVLKGPGEDVQELADHVIAERGVRHGQVVYLPAAAHAHASAHRNERRHDHGANPKVKDNSHWERPLVARFS